MTGDEWALVTLLHDLSAGWWLEFRFADTGSLGYVLSDSILRLEQANEVVAPVRPPFSQAANSVASFYIGNPADLAGGHSHSKMWAAPTSSANKIWIRHARTGTTTLNVSAWPRGAGVGTTVVGNPGGTGLTVLSTISIGTDLYALPSGGGASYTDTDWDARFVNRLSNAN